MRHAHRLLASSMGFSFATLCFAFACGGPEPPPPVLPASATAQRPVVSRERVSVSLQATSAKRLLCDVYARLDSDGDRRLTVDDEAHRRVRWPMQLPVGDEVIALSDMQQASRLAQELVAQLLEVESASEHVELDLRRVRSGASTYLLHRISTRFWDALTRRIEPRAESLRKAVFDAKMGSAVGAEADYCASDALSPSQATEPGVPSSDPVRAYVYVPESDASAFRVFSALSQGDAGSGWLSVGTVPTGVDSAWVERLTEGGRHGLLTLVLDEQGRGKPFVVPGGRFNEMYGWDSFFIAWGLVQSPDRVALARSMVDNFAYQIEHYGKILNANRTYYLTRSQPPFLTQMIRKSWDASPAAFRRSEEGRSWLSRTVAAAMREYRTVWNEAPRRTSLCDGDVCLARYHGTGNGQPPEVEPGHFDWAFQHFAAQSGLCAKPAAGQDAHDFVACARNVRERYVAGDLVSKTLDAFFVHDRCMRESGHDTSYRWFDAQLADRCAAFATVDLNALLLRYEVDLAELSSDVGLAEKASWCARAKKRAALMRRFLWNDERGLFLDYDVPRGHQGDVVAATTLYPLWSTALHPCQVELLTDAERMRLVANATTLLEEPGGLAATAQASVANVEAATVFTMEHGKVVEETIERQWDYPNGWAPHQMLAWQGLRLHGFDDVAERLSYKWLYTIARNAADYHGTVPEKFDVAARSHKVFQEYGNVNTDFAYIAEEGFGWMNASFVVGWMGLDRQRREALRQLVPPESLFVEQSVKQ